ncbi:hypothetical protein ACRAWF_43750 [Streptomyces sp. L7]
MQQAGDADISRWPPHSTSSPCPWALVRLHAAQSGFPASTRHLYAAISLVLSAVPLLRADPRRLLLYLSFHRWTASARWSGGPSRHKYLLSDTDF